MHRAATVDRRAATWGVLAVLVALAIAVLGSGNLRWFDAALALLAGDGGLAWVTAAFSVLLAAGAAAFHRYLR